MSWKWFEEDIFAELGETHVLYISDYDASTNRKYILESNLRSDTVPSLNYIANDREDAILPEITDRSSEGAANEGIMNHQRPIAIQIWFVSFVPF